MRYGENAPEIIDRVKVKIAELAKGLPPGVQDRALLRPLRPDLAGHRHPAEGPARGDPARHAGAPGLPAALPLDPDRALPLPIAVLIAFILMKLMGITSNIMSLGGIAIAIGVLVDAGIVIMENVFRHSEADGGRKPDHRDRPRRRTADRPADLLLPGHHPALLRAGLLADRRGGQAVPPAGLHQDLRHDRRDPALGHARAGARDVPRAGPGPPRGGQPGHARGAAPLRAGARRGAAPQGADARSRPSVLFVVSLVLRGGAGQSCSRRSRFRSSLAASATGRRAAARGLRSRWRGTQDWLDATARSGRRPGVHAAARRGDADVHAGDVELGLPDPGDRHHEEAGRGPAQLSRGRLGRRQGRAAPRARSIRRRSTCTRRSSS